MDRLNPVERRSRIGQFADTAVKAALAATDPAEIEPQGGKTAISKSLVEPLYDAIIFLISLIFSPG